MSGRPLFVAAALVAACSSSSSKKPKLDPDAPAGDVVDVHGTVTAHAGKAPVRPLAKGDTVTAVDVVATGSDGGVTIALRRNGARWVLGPGQEREVLHSVAWDAPPAHDGGGSTERNAAAGRNAEREAADTAETAREDEGDEESGGTGTAMALDEAKMGKKDDHRAEGQYRMKRPSLRVEVLETVGPLDPDEVASVLAGLDCADPPAGGADIALKIAADGTIASTRFDPTDFGYCVQKALAGTSFTAEPDASYILTRLFSGS